MTFIAEPIGIMASLIIIGSFWYEDGWAAGLTAALILGCLMFR